MNQEEFQLEVLDRLSEQKVTLAEVKTEVVGLKEKTHQLFEFHNSFQKDHMPNISNIKNIETSIKDHENGHKKFRIGMSIPILTIFSKTVWDILVKGNGK